MKLKKLLNDFVERLFDLLCFLGYGFPYGGVLCFMLLLLGVREKLLMDILICWLVLMLGVFLLFVLLWYVNFFIQEDQD